MAGGATIDPTVFADSLIEIVDDIRRDTCAAFGIRQFVAELVTMTPVPRLAGGPHNTTTTVVTLDPRPRVTPYRFNNGLEACGIDETGLVKVDQISLTYTEPELTGYGLAKGQEFFWRLTDAHGQEIVPRYYTVERDPFPSRSCNFGWTIWLRRAEGPT